MELPNGFLQVRDALLRAHATDDPRAARDVIYSSIGEAAATEDDLAEYLAIQDGLLVAVTHELPDVARDLIHRARALVQAPEDDCSLGMASVALRLLRDWALVSELLLDARIALARSSGELGWAYARADGIEVAALAHMQGVDDHLAEVLKRLSDQSRRKLRYEEHLVQGLTSLARQGRHPALVRSLARLVASDVAETQRAGGRFAPDELRSVAELVTKAEAQYLDRGAGSGLGATPAERPDDDACSLQ
jgi:hypothetical protein